VSPGIIFTCLKCHRSRLSVCHAAAFERSRRKSLTLPRSKLGRLTLWPVSMWCAAGLLACSNRQPGARPSDGGSHVDLGAACPPDVGPRTADCVSGVTDLVPVPVLRFQIQTPLDEDDYSYTLHSLPADGPTPRSAVFVSAKGSTDPEGAAVSIFWNVQDPTGAYLPLDPDPSAQRASFTPSMVGVHAITLEVTEIDGLRQTGQVTLMLNVRPIPCADDGVSPPCSDGKPIPGGTFIAGSADNVGNTDEHPTHPTTVAAFVMDKYEVTVGRFRRFLAGYTGVAPVEESGAHPLVPGSGWQSAWNAFLPVSSDDFKFALSECGGTWTNDIGLSEARPLSCVTWYEAFAFCIWDNKRLPTEAEWEYAAAGGDDQRTYPWGNDPPTVDRAVFGCLFDGRPSCSVDTDLPVVGSVAAGAGRWGHLDLAGSVWEWTLDAHAPYTAAPCDNCANLVSTDGTDSRVFRGGDFKFDNPSSLRATTRTAFNPAYPQQSIGFRCARAADNPAQ
jgi:sulfatase modifying factor 1